MNIDDMKSKEEVAILALIELIGVEARRLADFYSEAQDLQFEAPRQVRSADDETAKAKGSHSDPTPIIAADERRLALRLQVIRSERVLNDAAIALRGVRRGFERALDAYGIGAPEDWR